MKKILLSLILILVFSSSVFAEALRLNCQGIGQKTQNEKTTIKKDSSRIMSIEEELAQEQLVMNTRTKVNIYGEVSVIIDGSNSWIELPGSMMPDANNIANLFKSKKSNKFRIYNLSISDEKISGKFDLNILNKPTFNINRYSGTITTSLRDFSGECRKVDLEKKLF